VNIKKLLISTNISDQNQHTDRFATYDFLLMFHINHGHISYRFRDIRRFQLKIAKFSHPLLFCIPAEGVYLGIGYRRWGSEN